MGEDRAGLQRASVSLSSPQVAVLHAGTQQPHVLHAGTRQSAAAVQLSRAAGGLAEAGCLQHVPQVHCSGRQVLCTGSPGLPGPPAVPKS